jgi:hypothetical protein
MVDHPALLRRGGRRRTDSPERRAAATRPPLLAVVESGPTAACFLACRTSVDEALTAASIADAPHQDLEFVGRCSRGSLGYFCMAGAENDLEKSSVWPSSGTADRPPPRGKPSRINGLAPRWGRPFYLAIVRSVSHSLQSSTRRQSFVIPISVQIARHGTRHKHAADVRRSGRQRGRLSVVFLFASVQSGRLRARSANCRTASP